jgi:hypothetical protein
MPRPISKIHWDDPAARENEIQRRLRRAKAQICIFDFLIFLLATVVIFIVI